MKIIKKLSFLLILFLLVSCNRGNDKKNVIFILVDTLRADHLSLYGYERNTTPNIDKFANESIAFNYTFTPAPWTPVAMASIFTGLYPTAHGMVPPNSREEAIKAASKLSSKLYTLPEIYQDNGYYTMAVQSNPWLNEVYGYAQGFDEFVFKHRQKANVLNQEAFNLLKNYKAKKSKEPFYLYIHYLDPHNPYQAPREYDSLYKEDIKDNRYDKKAQEMMRKYDREIKYTDDKLGELFKFLKDNDLYDDTVIVFLSDHGEQFYERGHQGHGFNVYNEEIRVPFFIKLPRNEGKKIDIPVSSVDLFETLCTISSLRNESMQPKHGFSLITQEGLNKRKRTNILSEIKRKLKQKSLINNSLEKLVLDFEFNEKENDDDKLNIIAQRVYYIKDDSKEIKEINDESLKAKLFKDFNTLYHKILHDKITLDENDKVKMDDKTIKELKSLGYL